MQCGSEIDENSTVCSSCGAAQTNVESNGAFTNAITPKKFDVKIIAAAAVVVVILLVLLKALFGGSYKDPIDNMCKAMETGKGKYIYACLPDFYIDEEYEDMKKKEIIEELDEQAEDIYDSLEDEVGKKVKVSYKIKDKEKIDKDDLEDMQEMFEAAY